MDWILLVVLIVSFVVGAYKGFISALFSFFGIMIAIYLSYKICPSGAEFLQSSNLLGSKIEASLQEMIDGSVPGQFGSVEELYSALFSTRLGKMFGFVFKLCLKDVVVCGNQTAGQILAPRLNQIILKIIAFITIFLIILLILLFFKLFFNLIIKLFHLKWKNHLFGGVLGMAKGMCIFITFYAILVNFANFTLNESLLQFTQSGLIANGVYDLFATKIISLLL